MDLRTQRRLKTRDRKGDQMHLSYYQNERL